MSLQSTKASTNCCEIVIYKPNKADPVATRKKFADGTVVQRKHPELLGYPLEGVKVEDDSVALKILEWTSYEAHMVDFRGSEIFKEFRAVRDGSTVGESDMKHYHFYGPFPPLEPIVEYLLFTLKPGVNFDSFLPAADKALGHLLGAPGCRGVVIGKQVEDTSKVLVLIPWESVEHHQEIWPQKPEFADFRAAMAPFREEFIEGSEMWHVKKVEPTMVV